MPRTALTPRPVICVIDDLYRDRAVADAVVRGVFTHAGATLELGTDPDWLSADLPGDDEWRIEWSKFYYGLDLADAFCSTGGARYRDAWQRLVSGWLTRVPIGHDSADVAARRMQNWVYAWLRFAEADGFAGFDGAFEAQLVDGIASHARYVRENLTAERNHRTFELYSLFVVALAFPAVIDAGAIVELLCDNIRTDILPDGVQRELSTHYHMIVLRSLLGLVANARQAGIELAPDIAPRVERACEFALHIQRPDGTIPALSDSDTGSYRSLLRLAAGLFDRPDMALDAPPAATGVDFAASGYHVQRASWDPSEPARFLVFDCGPIGDGGHGHYDALHLEVASDRPLLVDPGRFTYVRRPPDERRLFKGTAAHNTVCVDGLDQMPFRAGRPKPPFFTTEFLGRTVSNDVDVMGGRVLSPCYDVIHERWVAFVDRDWWLVVDRLRATEEHDYELRWHLAPTATSDVVLRIAGGDVAEDAGWVSPTYGVREPAPIVVARARAANWIFATRIAVAPEHDPLEPAIHDDGVVTVTCGGHSVLSMNIVGEVARG